jgi:hypothetical protein
LIDQIAIPVIGEEVMPTHDSNKAEKATDADKSLKRCKVNVGHSLITIASLNYKLKE